MYDLAGDYQDTIEQRAYGNEDAGHEARTSRALAVLEYLERYEPRTLKHLDLMLKVRVDPIPYNLDADTEIFLVSGVLSDVPF